jgi:hypothetical protein
MLVTIESINGVRKASQASMWSKSKTMSVRGFLKIDVLPATIDFKVVRSDKVITDNTRTPYVAYNINWMPVINVVQSDRKMRGTSRTFFSGFIVSLRIY